MAAEAANLEVNGVDTPQESAIDPRDAVIEQLQAELQAEKEGFLRQLAESQNIIRRMRGDMDQLRKYATESLIRDLLPVLDNFERSIKAAEQGASTEAVIDGVRAIEKSLRRALEPAGLVRLESVGQPFDPERHEALATVETSDVAADTVTDEIEPGYALYDRVIRPARVRVSVAPEA